MNLKERIEEAVKEFENKQFEAVELSYQNTDLEEEAVDKARRNLIADILKAVEEEGYIKKSDNLKKEPFAWMRSWLIAYSKENELDVDKVMDWIFRQPMSC